MAIAGAPIVAQTSKLVVKAGKTDQMTVEGLQSLTLPLGATASTITLSQMGQRIDKIVASGLAYEEITVNSYFLAGDASQSFLQNASVNATQIQDARFYLDTCDFAALDLISDSAGYLQVGTYSAPSASKNEVYSNSVSFLPAGSFILFSNHVVGDSLSTTADAGSGATVSDSDSNFVNNGFEVGMTVYLDYVNSLDPLCCKIKTVTADTITLEQGVGDEASVPTFSGIATTAIHAGTPIEVDDYADVTCT